MAEARVPDTPTRSSGSNSNKPSASSTVRSAAGLTSDFVSHFRPMVGKEEDGSRLGLTAVSKRKRVAFVAIHGISPQQRYQFQDQVATSLASYLNAIERIRDPQATKSEGPWNTVVHWPTIGLDGKGGALRPSALRVFKGKDPEPTSGTTYDVYEGYWSPLSKGKTNFASAMLWLLRSTFLPTSSTAAVPCSPGKLFWDLGYVAGALAFCIGGLVLAAWVATIAWGGFVSIAGVTPQPTAWKLLSDPVSTIGHLPLGSYAELVVALLFAYFFSQFAVAFITSYSRDKRTRELHDDATPSTTKQKQPNGEHGSASTFDQLTIRARTFHRWFGAILILVLAGLGAVAVDIARAQTEGDPGLTWPYVGYASLVVIAFGALQVARYVADAMLENVLGDLQIYTTHDANSGYYLIRQEIVQTVTDALSGVLRAVHPPASSQNAASGGIQAPGMYYNAVHIFGHSLGSTVGMDVLIAVRKSVDEQALTPEQWSRIRSFTTFGTSLEKTKFFFDVRQPTISAAQDQWENDVYGRFFSCKNDALDGDTNEKGIFWTNLWYFRDIVANRIVSYQSDVNAADHSFLWNTGTAHDICRDYHLMHKKPPFAWVHSDYLVDPLFWEIVEPIVLRLRPPPANCEQGKWGASSCAIAPPHVHS